MKSQMIENRLSEVMGRRRISISELGRRAGVTRNTVARLYHGQTRQIDLVVLRRLCEALGVTPGDVLVYMPDEQEQASR